MKMKKRLTALWLTAGVLACIPGVSVADVDIIPRNVAAAPQIPAGALRQLQWTPVTPSRTATTHLATTGQTLNAADIVGPVAAWSVPATRGELTLTLSSDIVKNRVFAPNVLVLDQNFSPAAFFPSRWFAYQAPGVMSADRLEGVLKLNPAAGQQQIYVLAFTTREDLQKTTALLDPAKAYAKGIGNAVPDIPDPIARHVDSGTLKLNVQTTSGASILVGPLFGSTGPAPVPVGNNTTNVAPATATPPRPSAPMLNDTERYFSQAIRNAVEQGDIDKALKLLDEAERLGSTTARSVFISSVKGKG